MHELDWLIVGLYLALLVGVGVLVGRRPRTAEGYFLASRRMPGWAVVISVLATAQSAATFVGVPQAAFAGDLAYLSTNIGGMIAAVVIARVLIPAYYARRVTTPYELIEGRFGAGARRGTCTAYLVGRVFATGSRIFIGAIPTSLVIFGDMQPAQLMISIWVMVAAALLLSVFGGISGVIWTDVTQAVVYLGAAVAALIALWIRIPASGSAIWQALSAPAPDAPSKLNLISLSFSPAADMTLWTSLLCFPLLTIASHGLDNDMAQRLLTCPTPRHAARSVINGVLVGIPAVLLFLVIGLLLSIIYQRPDLMGDRGPRVPLAEAGAGESAKAFTHFIVHEMPMGLTGLMVAGLFAAGLSSVNSSISAMAATSVSDLYRPLRPGRDDRHYVRAGRWGMVIWSVALGLFGTLCITLYDPQAQTLLSFALSSMTFAYAGLIGVFCIAIFTRRGRAWSALAAMGTGFLVVLALQSKVFGWWTSLLPFTRATPGIDDGWRLGELVLAWPWHLLLAATGAALVCAIPRGRAPGAA
ncbi:MAG: sodium:solute symporter [Phycisphaerales bacterium]|nr:sodium:solute symporter [Phycisphaerales bacterium]